MTQWMRTFADGKKEFLPGMPVCQIFDTLADRKLVIELHPAYAQAPNAGSENRFASERQQFAVFRRIMDDDKWKNHIAKQFRFTLYIWGTETIKNLIKFNLRAIVESCDSLEKIMGIVWLIATKKLNNIPDEIKTILKMVTGNELEPRKVKAILADYLAFCINQHDNHLLTELVNYFKKEVVGNDPEATGQKNMTKITDDLVPYLESVKDYMQLIISD